MVSEIDRRLEKEEEAAKDEDGVMINEEEEAELKSMQGLVTKYVDPCEPVDVQWEAVS